MKCSSCNESLVERIAEPLPQYGNSSERVITVRCLSCGAVNVIRGETVSILETDRKSEGAPAVITRDAMRRNIIEALKEFYPRYRGYNGGYLAPVRDPDPDLFMSVLTELEQEGIIEYNDTQIALRLSPKYIESHQEQP